ncbi:uncharacterized protein SCDLUD_004141 [Saccharomycodes ludwigii]|uniref:uncharacterized protein n=1 Tax=Saccharomycodes ludwigii TaxID=36035 RepID=UPI001E89A19B|nr:hypothetical protein SCDLUD_004141 [Saccharomycodes ludwigii]KAH3899843.1 hypothetical protein SCDLUD_004141 [Saccharomycodes ludwigii]
MNPTIIKQLARTSIRLQHTVPHSTGVSARQWFGVFGGVAGGLAGGALLLSWCYSDNTIDRIFKNQRYALGSKPHN